MFVDFLLIRTHNFYSCVGTLCVYEKYLNLASLWWLRVGCDSDSCANIKMLNMHQERIDQTSKWQWMWCYLRNRTIDPHIISCTTQTWGNNPKIHQIQRWLHLNRISDLGNPTWYELHDMFWVTWFEFQFAMTHDIIKENATLYVTGVVVFPLSICTKMDENALDDYGWIHQSGKGFLHGRAHSNLSGSPRKGHRG